MTILKLRKPFISKTINRLRNTSNLSMTALAKQLGVSSKTICNWEKGYNYPNLANIIAISNYFEIKVDDLIGVDCITKRQITMI